MKNLSMILGLCAALVFVGCANDGDAGPEGMSSAPEGSESMEGHGEETEGQPDNHGEASELGPVDSSGDFLEDPPSTVISWRMAPTLRTRSQSRIRTIRKRSRASRDRSPWDGTRHRLWAPRLIGWVARRLTLR